MLNNNPAPPVVGLRDDTADISPCNRYRYALTRGPKARLAFVMLNPSTADAGNDDPTIRRCRSFAQREGFYGIHVVNLYAFRTTYPDDLFAQLPHVRIGAGNWDALYWAGRDHPHVVCAWGSHGARDVGHVAEAVRLLRAHGAQLWSLGELSKTHQPRHPLYLAGDTPLIPYTGV